MRFLLIGFFTVVSMSLLAGEPDKELHKKCIYPTVYVKAADLSNTGSGVIVKSVEDKENHSWENTIWTVAHIINEDVQLGKIDYEVESAVFTNWSTPAGMYVFNEVYMNTIDRNKDMCILTFHSNQKMPTVEIDEKPSLFLGNDVLKVGYGLSDNVRLDYGKVTGLNDSGKTGSLRISAFTVPGDSGGPVFHNRKLVGITKAVRQIKTGEDLDLIHHIAYTIPISYFKE